MIHVSDVIDSDMVLFFEGTSRESLLRSLIEPLLMRAGKISDADALYEAIMQREKRVSTVIGNGVALPHIKLPCFNDFFIVMGIVKDGVEWDALDGKAVHIVLLVAGPDDKQTKYLQLLSTLVLIVNEREIRDAILHSSSQEEVVKLLLAKESSSAPRYSSANAS